MSAARQKVSCRVVFHLPSLSAGMTWPCSTAIWRRPVTRNSRAMMTEVIQTGQSSNAVR